MTEFEKAAKYFKPHDTRTANRFWNTAVTCAAVACEGEAIQNASTPDDVAYNMGIQHAARAIRELKTGSEK